MSVPLTAPPAGSVFQFEITPTGDNRVHWPTGGPWYFRLVPAAFLSLWLCAWAVGEFAVAGVLLGMLMGKGPMGGGLGAGPFGWIVVAFLTIWLIFWTLGGVGAITALHFLLKRPRDEAVTLGIDVMEYDPGNSLLSTGKSLPNRPTSLRQWLKTQRPTTLAREQIDRVSLRWLPGRQQLTLDAGPERIEIGRLLTDVEREWLGQALASWAEVPLEGNATPADSDEATSEASDKDAE